MPDNQDNQFKTGDIVALKSGGPHMTVAEAREDGFINAEWFVSCEIKWHWFRAQSLYRVPHHYTTG